MSFRWKTRVFTVITGRRRVGKTELVDQALNDGKGDYVNLLLTRQTERNLVASLQEGAEQALGGRLIYGRNTAHLRLNPFPVSLLKEIFAAHCPKHTKKDLLALWTMTGGVARYVSLFMDAHAYTGRKMVDLFSPRRRRFWRRDGPS